MNEELITLENNKEEDIKNNIQNNNPLLQRVHIPGSTFQLPSRGLFYNNGELDPNVEMGEVHVHPMSAYDEILMKSPDALFSGDAIEKVFKRCIPQVLKPKELLAKDVDFLLICLRQITYGDELEVKYNHLCKEDSKEHSYIVNISTFLQKTKKIDPTKIGKLYSTTLENGQVVKLHPTKFVDLLKMYQESDPNKVLTPEEETKVMTFIISSVIESVDGITDRKMIEEWINAIPAGWLGKLSETIENAGDFGAETSFEITCKDCNKKATVEYAINPVSFFL